MLSRMERAGDREVSSDVGPEAAEMIIDMLAEMRSLGEAVIAADQVPERLPLEVIKLTNTKIVHLLPGEDDRRVVGGAMNLRPEQEAFLERLPKGMAAFSVLGEEAATFVQVRDYKAETKLPTHLEDARVTEHMQKVPGLAASLPLHGCRHCPRQCLYRDRVEHVVYNVEAAKRAETLVRDLRRGSAAGKTTTELLADLTTGCMKELEFVRPSDKPYAAYCYFTHIAGEPFGSKWAADFIRVAGDNS